MRIKRPPKKSPSTNPGIAAFILSLSTDQTPDDELPSLLWPTVNQGWQWPRTDLQHWIQPLNRFDAILDDVIKDYDLGSMEHAQTNAFTPRTKELVGAILAFEKVLLENSTNRKIFASFDRLNDLLRTTDLTILLATLRLALRPAQQYSSSNSTSSAFGIAEKRLLNLAQGWGTREYGLEMVDLAAESITIPSELDEFEWQFYKKAGAGSGEKKEDKKDKGKEVSTDAMEVELDKPSTETAPSNVTSTPAPKHRASFAPNASLATPIPSTPGPSNPTPLNEGLTTVSLGNVRANASSAVDILVDAIETYEVPEPSRLELLQKIRIAKSLSSSSDRRTLLVIRLLAIAVFCHTTYESTAQNKLFLYEPELIPQLAELVHPDREVPIEIQAAAFYALDAVAKFKTKLSEVASALNASVSHGILMYVLRRTVADLQGDNPVSTTDFTDSLFNLLSYFQSTPVGNMIVGAGVVSLLIDFVRNTRRDRLSVVTRAIVFLDTLMYGYSSAFNLFISTSGISVFVDRIKDEVELCVTAHSNVASTSQVVSDAPTGLLSFEQAALLKALFRAIHRLMQTAGTTEGLRNIIDTSLLTSVKTIIENRQVFGPQLFALAINVTAAFIHNEPTCLATIQEAKVPGALYDAIEDSIPPSIDVLQAIPNVIGALCLNTPGLTEFNARPIISRYFTIFSSERHVKILAERDNATMIGAAIDELMRHHPTLKEKILSSVLEALEAVRGQGKAFVPESQEGYSLVVAGTEKGTHSTATPSVGVESSISGGAEVIMQDVGTLAPPAAPKPEEQQVDNYVLSAIDVIGRFLDGLFQNITHCKDFIRLDPFPVLLEIFSLPCTPAMTIGNPSYNAISSLFRMLSEVKPTEVVTSVMKQIKTRMDDLKDVWDGFSVESRLSSLLDPTEATLETQNTRFRNLSSLLTYIALLSDIYSSLTYAHGKTATAVLAVLTQPEEAETLRQLGVLYRSASWETVLLKQTSSKAAPSASAEAPVDAGSSTSAPSTEATPMDTAVEISASSTVGESTSPNFAIIKDVVSNIPSNIVPLLQSAIKLFVHRRSGDSLHRKVSLEVSKSIGAIMKANLTWPESPDTSANLSFSTLMIASTATFLFDERLTATGIQTLLLVSFEKAGGMVAFLDLYAQYNSIASSLLESDNALVLPSGDGSGLKPELKLPVVYVFGGIKTALNLLYRLSSHKTLHEAPQTALLLAQNKDQAVDAFEPHQFIVKLRATILPSILVTWDAAWLNKSPPNVVRNIVRTLVNILRAEGEESSATPATNGFPQSPFAGMMGGIPSGLAAALAGTGGGQPFVVDEERVTQLMDMGFPRGAARNALTRCRNNTSVATEYLLSHPDIVGAARLAEANAPPPAPEPENPGENAAANDNPVEGGNGDAPALAPEGAPVDVQVDAPAAVPVANDGQAQDEVRAAQTPAAILQEAIAEVEEALMGRTGLDVEMTDARQGEDAPVALDPAAVEEAKKEAVERKKALDEAREELKPTFLPRALKLADAYPDLVFDIKGAFSLLNSVDDKSAPTIKPLLDDLKAAGTNDQAISTRLRVIALLATDAVYRSTIEASRSELMEVLVTFQQRYTSEPPAEDARPQWLASAMLVADSLFSVAEVPVSTTILAEGEALPDLALICQGPKWETERRGFFELAMHVFESGTWSREVLISTLRLLLILTRDHELAVAFAHRDGLRQLFKIFGGERPEAEGCRSYAVMILRHIIEEKDILRTLMEREIGAWFAMPRTRVADVTGFLRGTSSSALRNPAVFLEATQAVCKLVSADAPGHYHVALQNETPSPTISTETESAIRSPFADAGGAAAEMAVDDSTATRPIAGKSTFVQNVSPIVDSSVHFLMTEVIEFSKLALVPLPSPSSTSSPLPKSLPSTAPTTSNGEVTSEDSTTPELSTSDKETPAEVPLGDFFQTSFALSCLAELLSSYSACKSSFLTFSTRRSAKETVTATPTVHKSKSSFLYFLLNDLIPVGSVVAPHDFESKRRTALSTWAAMVVVALCHDAEAGAPTKESTAEITTIRKIVLDGIAKAIKEATTSSEPTDIRYGRLFALSDLCCRLLTARPFAAVSKPPDEHSMQLAKLMLEKNFAVILTNALADVDLNFPSVNNLINSILRPLEQLTKVVTKVGRSKNSAHAARHLEDDDISTDDSEDDSDSASSQEAQEADDGPDIYRNSALGMYEGELETGHAGEDAYMSDNSEDYDEDDEMMDEMEDGMIAGSDVSDVSDEDADEVAQFEDELADMISQDSGDDEEDEGDESDSDSEGLGGDDVEIIEEDDEDVIIDEDQDQGGEDWIDEPEGGAEENPDMDDGFGGAPLEHDEDEDSLEGEDSVEEDDLEGVLELEFEADLGLPSGALGGALGSALGGGRHGGLLDGGWDLLGDAQPRRGSTLALDDAAALFGHRGPPPNASTPSHPLLVDSPATDNRQDTPILRRSRTASSRDTPEYQAWVQSIEQAAGPGAVEAIQELLSQHGLSHLSGPEQIRLQRTPGPDGSLAIVIDPAALQAAGARLPGSHGGRSGGTSNRLHHRTPRTPTDRLSSTSEFLPVATAQRWQEESKVLQGSVLIAERTAILSNHVINVLHPPARAVVKQAREEELAKKEKVAREEQEKAAREKQEMITREEERKAREAAEAAEAEAQVNNADEMEVEETTPTVLEGEGETMQDVRPSDDVSEVISLARSLAAGLGVPSARTPPNTEPQADAPPPAVPTEDTSATNESANEEEEVEDASGSGGGERVIITIHGQEHDITDTGIDATFLEALPDDMREEVLAQHFREIQAAGPPPAVPSQIDSEFLAALPPDVRAEVLRQEAAEQRREQAASRAADAAATGDEADDAAEMDPASFLASLDPQLRQAVLMEQEDGFLSTLPPNLIAEANVLREANNRRHAARQAARGAPANAVDAPAATSKKAPPHREAIQLLDKSGLATLVRLLFFPQPLRKNSLQKVLVNLCENSRTRMELINLLLTILQDGTRDVSAVDKSFSQMSIRASKALVAKDTPRRKGPPDTPGASALPHFPGESVPNLIAQRCLEALMFLVHTNEQSPLFFLTEQELTVGLNRRASKKGKGKEKAAPSSTFPVIVLLGLLDRPALLKTQSMMDSLTQLLAAITKSLSILQKKPPSDTEDAPVPPAETTGQAPEPASTTTDNAPVPAVAEVSEPTAASGIIPAQSAVLVEAAPSADVLLKSPPQIPTSVLRLVVNILDSGECSSKTFQQTLVLIQNLSYLPEARTTISDELKSRAQGLADRLLPDLDELQAAIGSSADVRGVTLAKFSPASSLQAKLLRVLKTIDWIHSPHKKAASEAQGNEAKLSTDEETVSEIYDSFTFGGLWAKLGGCLAAVEQKPELLYIATVLLPLIESLMVVSKYVGAKARKDQRLPQEALSPGLSELPPNSMEATFLTFTDEHRKILNTMVRNNPSLLAGSFEILRHNPKVLEFDNKRSYFFSRLHDRSQRQRSHYGTLQVNVRRQYVFEDSFRNLQGRRGEEIKHGKLSVKFYDEEGVDAGGVTREWFSVLARQMFNPGYALFQPQAADALTYQPNKASSINPDHLSFFKFVGRIIGKALHDQRILEAYFSRAVYKHMLGRPVDHRDLESIDPEYYKSLVWMLENDIDGILDLTFSVERDDFGAADIIDLIPDGRNTAVTNENKAEYVRLIADQRLSVEIKEQMDAMLKGLYEIVPKDLLKIFSEKELELLISGLPEIDVDEWRANTVLHNFSPTDPVIGYFWRVVRSFSMEERAKLLQFVSGSSRVPLDGFGSLQGMTGVTKFSITNAGNTKALPTAHTCFNQLDIASNFESYEELRKALLTAITEGGEGFGFA